jgi:3-dehydroquinate synthase
LRGVRVGFVPTSLLAMVDAAIGGKNGVDLDDYKNVAGTIRQPEFLLYDKNFLRTLPEAEWRNGMAEVIKHACLQGSRHLKILERNSLGYFQKNASALDDLVSSNARFKLKIVQSDEKETGPRRLLNFGHTLGHALEKQYELFHGEAISIGMRAACRFSEILLGFTETERVSRLLEQYGLPSEALFHPEKILHLLRSDKKRNRNFLHLVLLEKTGAPVIRPVPINKLQKLLDQI